MKKLLFCSAVVLSSHAYALDIKGIKVDAPLDCQVLNGVGTALIPGTDVCSFVSKDNSYMLEASFLSGRAKMTVTTNSEKTVESVFVFGFSYAEAAAALTEKFGKSVVTTSVIQNGLGAKFDQELMIWSDGLTTMRLQRHGSRVNQPVLSLTGEIFSNKLKSSAAQSHGNI